LQLVKEKRSEETKEDKCVEFYYNWVFSLASPTISTKQLCFQENRKKQTVSWKDSGLRTQEVLDPSFQSCQKTRTCLQALRAGSSLSLSLSLSQFVGPKNFCPSWILIRTKQQID
jgi:hypothetical protein